MILFKNVRPIIGGKLEKACNIYVKDGKINKITSLDDIQMQTLYTTLMVAFLQLAILIFTLTVVVDTMLWKAQKLLWMKFQNII